MQNVTSLPLAAGAVLFIGAIVALAMLGAVLVHRLVRHDVLVVHNEIAGFILAVIGVVYAVLLAFLAIGVWERFEGAEQRTYEEANQLSVLYRRADEFSDFHVIRAELKHYARAVITDEWPKMAHGESSADAGTTLERIAYQVRHLQIRSMGEQNGQSAMLQALSVIETDRDDRLSMGATGINTFLWTVLALGGVVTIGFTYLFAFENIPLQVTMIGALAFALALVLYLIAALDFPFRGEVSVTPEAFRNALANFGAIGS